MHRDAGQSRFGSPEFTPTNNMVGIRMPPMVAAAAALVLALALLTWPAAAQRAACAAFSGSSGGATLNDMNTKCCNDGRGFAGSGHRRSLQAGGECQLASCSPACAEVFLPVRAPVLRFCPVGCLQSLDVFQSGTHTCLLSFFFVFNTQIYTDPGCRALIDEALHGGSEFVGECAAATGPKAPTGAVSGLSEGTAPLSSSGCGARPDPAEWVAGSDTDHTIDVDGVSRMFKMHLPATFGQATTPTSLVFSFHGWGSSARGQSRAGMSELSDTLPPDATFITVYPQGLGNMNAAAAQQRAAGGWGTSVPSWNGGGCAESPGPLGETCEQFATGNLENYGAGSR